MKADWQKLQIHESTLQDSQINVRKETYQNARSNIKHIIREGYPLPSSARTSGIPLEMPIPKRKTSRTKQNLVPRMTMRLKLRH